MNFRNTILLGTAALCASLLSCRSITLPKGAGLAAYQRYDRPAKLPSDPDNVRVEVSLSRQRAYVMEGNTALLVMPISVGAPESPSPRGNFRIREKTEKKRARTDGYAHNGTQVRKSTLGKVPAGWSFTGTPLPYWCGFAPNSGFHAGWVKHYPCTDGCIRMHENLAPKFYRLVKIGTPVSIAYSQPEDATFGSIPLPPDAGPLPDYPGSMYTGDGYFQRHKAPEYEGSF